MARKVNPTTFRLGITLPWASRWFYKKSLRFYLEEDHVIREYIEEKVLAAGIAGIVIDRSGESVRVTIQAAKPGIVIGRGGKGAEDLKAGLLKIIAKLRAKRHFAPKFALSLTIEELKRFDVSAAVVAQTVASDIERRQAFRRVLKRNLESIMQNRDMKGAKIRVGGRLNGAEISRHESVSNGKMPLQTLRANVDYGEATAYNTYGTIGVKVWIYKGEIFEEEKKA